MLRTENNPPLFFLITHFWSALVGLDAALLRIPSAIFSALTVWPLFLLTRKLGGRATAITAALLFTLSNYHFGFAHEVRGYSLFALLSVTSFWLLIRMIRAAEPTRPAHSRTLAPWHLSTLCIVNIALVYTHFFGWLMIGVEMLCVLLVKDLRITRRSFFIGLIITITAYAPYAFIFLNRAGSSIAHGTWVSVRSAEEIWNMLWRWSNMPVIAFFLVAVILFVSLRERARGSALGIGLIWTFVPLLGMWLAQLKVPMYLDRYLIYASPGFYLLASHALTSVIDRDRWRIALPAIAVCGMAFTFAPWKDNGLHPSHVVAQVDAWQIRGKRMPVLIAPSWYALTYVYQTDKDLFGDPENFWINLRRGFHYEVENARDVDEVITGNEDGAVLVDSWALLVDTQRTIHGRLRERFAKVDSVEADKKVWVYRYTR